MKIQYCEICNTRLTPEAFGLGDAIEIDGRPFCVKCVRQFQNRAPGETVLMRPPGAPDGRPPGPNPRSSAALRAIRQAREGAPPARVRVRCPRCSAVVTAESPGADAGRQREYRIVCGSCGTTLVVRKKKRKSSGRLRRRRRRR